jgi:hypothetical protein
MWVDTFGANMIHWIVFWPASPWTPRLRLG